MTPPRGRIDGKLHSSARIVGVDYGTKSVGIVLADPLRLFVQPYGAFSQDQAVSRLVELDRTEGLERVVIGWPLLENGEEGLATQRVQQFINRLKKVLPRVEFHKWDERFTSEEARDRLISQKQQPTKGRVDILAAGIVLQEFLDST